MTYAETGQIEVEISKNGAATVKRQRDRTRSVFDGYNIIDKADLRGAGERLEEYAKQRKRERAARLRRVK